MSHPLVLASASPRRRSFLQELGIPFVVDAADLDERRAPGEAPAAFARRMAAEKAEAVYTRRAAGEVTRAATEVVLAADTIVVLGDHVLGKPESTGDAVRMLQALSGRSHRVISGVAVHTAEGGEQRAVITEVRFRPLTEAEITWYAATGEPMDKAGAYAIQGLAGWFVSEIRGSHSNVIGLPLAETLELLGAAHVQLPWRNRPDDGSPDVG